MKYSEYATWSHAAAEWSTRYLNTLASRPVRSQLPPGSIAERIDAVPPEAGTGMQRILDDFATLIPDGMTHWQHPGFFAYFPANAAPASMIAEQLAATLACQCMLWQTSPAATELEICMVDWLRQSFGLPAAYRGVLQDTASSATLCAILTMREQTLHWSGNRHGLAGLPPLRVYASAGTHSSVDKAMWVSGLGQDNLVKIPTDDAGALQADVLHRRIRADRAAGYLPAGIVICVGGTSTGASDRVAQLCDIAAEEQLYTHVDAAWAGAAMICPEFRPLWAGVERADSIVVNPHKWLGASMECSAHFVRDPDTLVRTLAIHPEYLQTPGGGTVVNFSEWSVQLGRRFRALKVWFLLRAYGLQGLRGMIRNHVSWSQALCERLRARDDMQIVTEPVLSLFSFRYRPAGLDPAALDALNDELLQRINDDGRIYLTQTRHQGQRVLRFVAGQFELQKQDLDRAYDVIVELAGELA